MCARTRIEEFGWRGAVEPGIGRVVGSHGDYYHLVCNERPEGEILARKKKSVFVRMKSASPDDMRPARIPKRASGHLSPAGRPASCPCLSNLSDLIPITGDFVRFRYNAQGDSLITEVLPRVSHFERKDPTARRPTQTLAVNFDTLFLMMALDGNFSEARLRRYLDLASDMGKAEAVVVLTKRDLAASNDLPRLAPSIASVAISARTGEGLDALAPYLAPRRTVAFVGSSGVGKSTLLNVLAGEDRQATQEVQAWSGKGRHTTTTRTLVRLPSGALVVDTPGIREIGRVGEVDLKLAKGESTHRYRKGAVAP